MAQIAQVQIGGIQSFSVVRDLNFFLAPFFDGDLYSGGSGIDGVFNKFLYGRCGALNNLARSKCEFLPFSCPKYSLLTDFFVFFY